MDETNRKLDGEEKGVQEQADSEEPERVSGIANLYRFVYAEADAMLGFILELMDALVEKGILTDEDRNRIIKEGTERWKRRE